MADATTFETVRGVSDLISVFRHGNTLKSVHINTAELPEEEWEGLYSLMKSGLGAELTHLGLMVIWPDPDRELQLDKHGTLLRLCARLKSCALSGLMIDMGPPLEEGLNHDIIGTFWHEISQLIPSLPLTIQTIVLELYIITRPKCPSLQRMVEETAQMEAAIIRRFGKSLPVLILNSKFGQPFSAEEEECLMELFPTFKRERAIQFDRNI